MAADDKDLNHAWSYFALHANQRITVFNYFVVFSGVLCTGIAAAVQASPKVAAVGVALGLLLAVLSFVFWKLDQRTAFLIKHAEDILKQLEPSTGQLIGAEEQKTAAAKRNLRMWTYGQVFRTIFAFMALIGIAGAVLAAFTASGALAWGSAKPASACVTQPDGYGRQQSHGTPSRSPETRVTPSPRVEGSPNGRS